METHWHWQLFADGPGAEESVSGADPAGGPSPAAPAPSFDEMLRGGYQAEFDRRVSKAIETAKAHFTDPRVAQLQEQLTGYQRRDAVLAAGVRPEFAEFVAYKVSDGMAGGDAFADGLKAFVEANPQYAGGSAQPAAWGAHQTGGGAGRPDGVEAAFQRLNPSMKIGGVIRHG